MISEKVFIEILGQIENQIKKEEDFINFLFNGYMDGILPVPTFSSGLIQTTVNLLASFFEDEKIVFEKRKPGDTYMNWIDWFIYENDFGRKKMEAYLDEKEYIISNSSEMYKFLKKFIKIK